MDETDCKAYDKAVIMGKIWTNNSSVDRLAMLQQTELEHPGVNQVAIEKDWWVTIGGCYKLYSAESKD